MKSSPLQIARVLALTLFAGVLYGASAEFYAVASGTGQWIAGFSPRWGIMFVLFVLLAVAIWICAGMVLRDGPRLSRVNNGFASFRERIGWGRWPLGFIVALLPVWFLQYSPWGIVFGKPYIRLLIWFGSALVLAFLVSSTSKQVLTWSGILAGLLVSGAVFVIAVPFQQVTSYPFALGWSEGNRLWDYSLLFGSAYIAYPSNQPPSAYLEPGRLLVGGLPYLLPNISIAIERLWLALLDVLPYLLLGWVAFRSGNKDRRIEWFLAGIWGFVFLAQGPIHPPLLICAILVAFAWRKSLWLALPLMLLAGYFAELSRYTWIFAPAIWAVMLEFGSFNTVSLSLPAIIWKRSLAMGTAALFGSLILPKLLSVLGLDVSGPGSAPGVSAGGVSVETITGAATQQPLLWYRLLPNATYGSGILVGALNSDRSCACRSSLSGSSALEAERIAEASLGLPLAAFLGVGLIISTKIGGGGDLHNLDQFLVGLLFTAVLAWSSVGLGWSLSLPRSAMWVRGALVLAIAIPAFQPLMALHPISFAEDANWLVVLADATRPKDLGSLPDRKAVESDLQHLRAEISLAQARGDILFIDQRQLLTFGYITGRGTSLAVREETHDG